MKPRMLKEYRPRLAGVFFIAARTAQREPSRDARRARRSLLIEAVDIAALIELANEARVVEILRLVNAHFAIVVDLHHGPDTFDRRIGLGRQLHRLRIDLLLRARF